MLDIISALGGFAVPALGRAARGLLKCKPCMTALAAIALLFAGALYGAHVEQVRSEVRLERARQAAAAAAVKRDAAIAADLERKYGPELARLGGLNQSLLKKVEDYAKRKPVAAGKVALSCKLGAAAGLLRELQSR